MVQERPGRIERRLSAILAADVAGYSRLMHNDEEATHARLTMLLTEAVEPSIAQHGGRIVKNTGDGLLAEFGVRSRRFGLRCYSRPVLMNLQSATLKTGAFVSVSASISAM
jgi:class 3 adenylate cyclase